MNHKKELKQEYKDTPLPAGVLQIENKQNRKVFIVSAANLNGKINSQRFQLKLGSHRNPELQRDWNHYGADAFSFTILEQLKESESLEPDLRARLDKVTDKWLAKLDPYEEKGYHTRAKARN